VRRASPRRSVSALTPNAGSHQLLSQPPFLGTVATTATCAHRLPPARFVASPREGIDDTRTQTTSGQQRQRGRCGDRRAVAMCFKEVELVVLLGGTCFEISFEHGGLHPSRACVGAEWDFGGFAGLHKTKPEVYL